MFDYRYHALSLAAVLLALAVGVLIGVAIGDSNLVSSAKNGVVHELRSEVSGANHQIAQLHNQLSAEETYGQDLYQITVHGLLSGRRVGLVFLGSSSDQIDGLVREAVTQAGGELVTVVAVHEPLDVSGIAQQAVGTPYAELGTRPHLITRLGIRIARQLVGSDHRLLAQVQGKLLSSFDGKLEGLTGLVVARSEPEGMTSEEAQATGEFESGLLEGALTAGVPTVGVELSSTNPSQIPWYRGHNISSVDNIDIAAGRAALAFTLAGVHGTYGEKSTAESGLLPRVGSASLP
jgi:Copper transport outer membrane protein, MctB